MDNFNNTVLQGQKSSWSVLEKLGEGDAGEVYRVENVLDRRRAILKRPRRSVFTNEIRRQAEQIRLEGRILAALPNQLQQFPDLKTPELIDQSRPGSEFSERFFIVISTAAGLDLSWLARACRLGIEPAALQPFPTDQQLFLARMIKNERIPPRILLAALSALLGMFEAIHTSPLTLGNEAAAGLIWNDVKPDHIFWNPHSSEITLIDWGNSRPLDTAGVTRDMRSSPADDQRQFLSEMGRFIEQNAPDLRELLQWPEEEPLPGVLNDVLQQLRERIHLALRDENRLLIQARLDEAALVQPGLHPENSIAQLSTVHERIIAQGEIPDYPAALRFASAAVANLAAAADLSAISKLCEWASTLPGSPGAQWGLVAALASTAARESEPVRSRLAAAVPAAAAGDWDNCLWALLDYLQGMPEPDHWNDLISPVRVFAGGTGTASVRPLLTFRRAALTLQAGVHVLEDTCLLPGTGRGGNFTPEQQPDRQRLDCWSDLLIQMREISQNWIQLDPLPPHSSLAYDDVDNLIHAIDEAMPGTGSAIHEALAPAREQVAAVQQAWNNREFSTAARTLRRLLIWDPDRRRLLRADQALQDAPDWIHRLRTGPSHNGGFLTSITDLEFEGRELRNRLGPAFWLDLILEALKAIRTGTWPGDILAAQPALLAEIPWLQTYERAEIIRHISQPNIPPLPLPAIHGIREEAFGPEDAISFLEPADAWIPEARGSSARAYHSLYRTPDGDLRPAVLKLMRVDKADYAMPLFHEEILVLDAMRGVPGVNPYLECGFLWLGPASLPADHELDQLQALRGEAMRIGSDSAPEFLRLLEKRTHEGWTPYLLLEKRRREDNLLLICDASLNRGNLRPPAELLRIAVQICDVLIAAHQRKVVYRDHKILHYYWQPDDNGVFVIDWNVARYHPDGLDDVEIHMDLVQLGARGLHHLLTGRTAPGALPLGPTRPEEIEQSAQSYRAQWTYDDQRLGEEVRVILEQLLAGAYTNASDLRADLKRACLNLE